MRTWDPSQAPSEWLTIYTTRDPQAADEEIDLNVDIAESNRLAARLRAAQGGTNP